MSSTSSTARAGRRLAAAKSPYLIEHKDDAVEWHEWGDEAFELSRAENKPIFLSAGYATCHWCHVMQRESFSGASEAVTAYLNENFVRCRSEGRVAYVRDADLRSPGFHQAGQGGAARY